MFIHIINNINRTEDILTEDIAVNTAVVMYIDQQWTMLKYENESKVNVQIDSSQYLELLLV